MPSRQTHSRSEGHTPGAGSPSARGSEEETSAEMWNHAAIVREGSRLRHVAAGGGRRRVKNRGGTRAARGGAPMTGRSARGQGAAQGARQRRAHVPMTRMDR